MPVRRVTWILFALTLGGAIAGILVPAGLGWDFANFYDAGRRVLSGQVADLYHPTRPIGGAPPQGTLGFYGTPISALFYAPLGALRPEAALVVFKIQNVAALFATFGVLYSFNRRFVPGDGPARERYLAWFAGLCLLFQPFWTIFRVGGQTTPTALFFAAVALVLFTRGRLWLAASFVVAATMVKPALAPAVLFLMLAGGASFFWRATTVGALAAVVSAATLGIQVHRDFLELMIGSTRQTWSWHYNSSLFMGLDNVRLWAGAAADAGLPAAIFAAANLALLAGILGLIVVLTVAGRRRPWSVEAQRHFTFTLAILLFLLASRTVWEHYLSFLFLWLAGLLAHRSSFSRTAQTLIGAIVFLSIFQNFIFTDWLRHQITPASLGSLLAIAAYKSGPLLLTTVFVIKYWREWFQTYEGPEWKRLRTT